MTLAKRLGFEQSPVFLVDGTAFFYRGYHAFGDLSRSDGFPTSALFMIFRLLFKLLKEQEPSHLVFFLDGRGPNFRSKIYSNYKANRDAMPEPLARQVEPLRQGLRLLGVPVIVPEDAEADDGIATLAARFRDIRPVVIVGADKDLKQCLDDRVVLYDPSGKAEKLTTKAAFTAECGIEPASWPDLQALVGDTSDNIPGVPGVGPKTALAILRTLPTLEAVRDNLDAVPVSARKKIEPFLEAVFTYRALTRLRTDILPDTALADALLAKPDTAGLRAFLESYELRTLAREAAVLPTDPAGKAAQAAAPKAAGAATQLSLFGNDRPCPPPVEPGAARDFVPATGLPDLSGRAVALVPVAGGFTLSLGPAECATDAAPAELAPLLATASRVAVPSVKALLALDPAFEALPLPTWFDLGLAAYLLNPEQRNYGFERLRDSLFADPAVDASDLSPADTAKAAARLADLLASRLEAAGLSDLVARLELPLVPVLLSMERIGIGIDTAALAAFGAEVATELARLEGAIRELAGEGFNPRSSRQLGEVLYGRMGLKPRGKTPGGAASTSQEALERLAGENPLVDRILEFRKLEKLRSTYLDPLPRLADAAGRIHTTFNNLATATGRLSSSNPNLQNIPIRGTLGRRMRECFVAAAGKKLVAADYSQIELRVLAHLSGEPALLAAFEQGADIHARTAAILFDKAEADIRPDERRQAKTINFGLLYGMGPQKLSRDLGIKLDAAKAFIEKYFERLSGLSTFYQGIVDTAKAQGFVTTLAGRRRLLPEIHSANSQLASQARRQAINTVVQGGAADIIKMAMLAAHNDPELAGLGAAMVLQVHDELLLETPEAAAQAAGERLSALMCGVVALAVPLAVDWGAGQTWGQAH
ncbi:DNA polymerase I [Solidesulfovibrio carbinoliphilus subsp. oakridgensis]|uniref:DNA polymerase I n=1 Tax=Solidesulfovibrio carbinoliphilus subsp. oakridgensis TaxID=694327 RepID=G7Q9F6_9BACT|nr:DNA polymerase I [Solidesulfovibrio carbinoliphilus]EHJ48199.1 DNA polymerase I [Solidesulfovibrio carbinoliphilus subsp. oakridgensis]